MHIVRLNPTELAIQFYPRLLPGESPKSLLRRFQKKGNKIVTSDTELDPYDALPQVSQMTDSLGFFAINTTTFRQVRRYSN
jgi:hypothetical protein